MHLGIQELVVILIIVLVLFGGKKISGLGKALGTSMREFKEEVNKKGLQYAAGSWSCENSNVMKSFRKLWN